MLSYCSVVTLFLPKYIVVPSCRKYMPGSISHSLTVPLNSGIPLADISALIAASDAVNNVLDQFPFGVGFLTKSSRRSWSPPILVAIVS